MIISASGIKKTRRLRYCARCSIKIAIGSSAIRLYGSAERSDPKYAIYLHPDCCIIDPKLPLDEHKKILRAKATILGGRNV